MITADDARRLAMRELREMIPPELVRELVEADFTQRYERLCEAHAARVLSVTGPQRRESLLALRSLGRLQMSAGGNYRIIATDHPPGLEFEVCWRPDTRVEAFLTFVEGAQRCGNNFAVLAHAARTAAVSPGKPNHPRPHAGDGDELLAVVSELMALGLDVGRRYLTRPGRELRWGAPAEWVGRAGADLVRRTAGRVGPAPEESRHADLSTQGVGRQVQRSALRVVIGVLTVFGAISVLPGLFLLNPSLIFYFLAGAGVIGVVTGWIELGPRRQKVASNYVERVHRDLSARANEASAALRRILTEQNFQPGLEQLTNFEQQYTAFAAMLRRKLDPSELTFTRYLAMSEQVFLAGLDNLTNIVDILDGLSAMDVGHISRRLRHLETDGIDSPAQDAEISALKERLHVLEAQQARVGELLAENEVALTRLVHAGSAIAAMDTAAPQAQVGMETAMRELQELADRAPAYSRERD